jgi:hypothetical protein
LIQWLRLKPLILSFKKSSYLKCPLYIGDVSNERSGYYERVRALNNSH